jgi:hypothetical protein
MKNIFSLPVCALLSKSLQCDFIRADRILFKAWNIVIKADSFVTQHSLLCGGSTPPPRRDRAVVERSFTQAQCLH